MVETSSNIDLATPIERTPEELELGREVARNRVIALIRLFHEPWMDFANCRDVGPDTFFPDADDKIANEYAKSICDECPVREECATAGRREGFGVWGGISERQRRGKRRRSRSSMNQAEQSNDT